MIMSWVEKKGQSMTRGFTLNATEKPIRLIPNLPCLVSIFKLD